MNCQLADVVAEQMKREVERDVLAALNGEHAAPAHITQLMVLVRLLAPVLPDVSGCRGTYADVCAENMLDGVMRRSKDSHLFQADRFYVNMLRAAEQLQQEGIALHKPTVDQLHVLASRSSAK